jgi:hypothetical protein
MRIALKSYVGSQVGPATPTLSADPAGARNRKIEDKGSLLPRRSAVCGSSERRSGEEGRILACTRKNMRSMRAEGVGRIGFPIRRRKIVR